MKRSRDKEILEGILNHDSSVIKNLYESCFPKVERMVINFGGDSIRAKDIFQDAMIIVYRKICNDDLTLSCSITTYIYAVCKNLWLQEYKSTKLTVNLTSEQAEVVKEPDLSDERDQKILQIFDRHFERLSKDCQKILRMHFKGRKIALIKKAMKYDSIHHTMDRKYRCKSSLIKRIMNDPEYKELKNETKEDSSSVHGRNVG